MDRKKIKRFKIRKDLKPKGDQPQAIKKLTQNIKKGEKYQVLLGVTGSGKTFTMAHTIMELNLPALILAPNKTLAAQLYSEFRQFFPGNAVEYFISYYDYYQPEAYLPSRGLYIAKDASINQQIDRMRHSATHALLERKDVIIISSVSCIYGLGSPKTYLDMALNLKLNQFLNRDVFLRTLLQMHYKRKEQDFDRGEFRVRGDIVEVYPPYEDIRVIRVEFFGNYVEGLFRVDPLNGEVFEELEEVSIYPGSHYVSSEVELKKAINSIQKELRERIQYFEKELAFEKAERIKERTLYDLELIQEVGFCPGIENYSRHLTGRKPNEPPPTLLEYFPKKFLMFIDESHITVPQVGGMYRGDRSRKETLVEHAFRLPSALDNRPLNFSEFESFLDKVIYVSATPGDYEIQKSKNLIIEQIIRPTGLLDPVVEVRQASQQVKNLLEDIKICVSKKERVLVTTLTKKSAEDLTGYYESLGIKIKYLHSDIHTLERSEIIRDLRVGKFDVLVGINLLREGLDIPEVSLVAILDADKEGFLRSERSLIQTMGRAARNVSGRVILYADYKTRSIERAILETKRRRKKQEEHNQKCRIIPQSVSKESNLSLLEVFESRYGGKEKKKALFKISEDLMKDFETSQKLKKRTKVFDQNVALKIETLREKMKMASEKLEFEKAAQFRDEIKGLEMLQLTLFEKE